MLKGGICQHGRDRSRCKECCDDSICRPSRASDRAESLRNDHHAVHATMRVIPVPSHAAAVPPLQRAAVSIRSSLTPAHAFGPCSLPAAGQRLPTELYESMNMTHSKLQSMQQRSAIGQMDSENHAADLMGAQDDDFEDAAVIVTACGSVATEKRSCTNHSAQPSLTSAVPLTPTAAPLSELVALPANLNPNTGSSSESRAFSAIDIGASPHSTNQQRSTIEANFEGYNTYEYANGSRYDGEWRAGLKHGSGSMLLANGDVYTGQWQAGEYCGCGRYVHHNGTVFEGIFQANKKTGHGRCYYNQNGSFASEASSYSWNAGDVFDGEFLNNMRHGICHYTWVTGDTLSCEWVHGSCPAWEAKNNEIVAKMNFQRQHQCDVQMTTAHQNLVQERNAEQQLSFNPLELDLTQLSASMPTDNAAISSENNSDMSSQQKQFLLDPDAKQGLVHKPSAVVQLNMLLESEHRLQQEQQQHHRDQQDQQQEQQQQQEEEEEENLLQEAQHNEQNQQRQYSHGINISCHEMGVFQTVPRQSSLSLQSNTRSEFELQMRQQQNVALFTESRPPSIMQMNLHVAAQNCAPAYTSAFDTSLSTFSSALPRIIASIANMLPYLPKVLSGLTVLHTVSEAKNAITCAFSVHPAKQSLMFEDRGKNICWMQDSHKLSSYTSDAVSDVYIRVYLSFELLFKHNERWIIIPSAACDTVEDLKLKLARELRVESSEVSVFLPEHAGPDSTQVAVTVHELVHQVGRTLLFYGILNDCELFFKITTHEKEYRPPQQNHLNYIESPNVHSSLLPNVLNMSAVHPLPPNVLNTSAVHPLPPNVFNTSAVHPLPPNVMNSSGVRPLSQNVLNTSAVHPLPPNVFNTSAVHPLPPNVFNTSAVHPLPPNGMNSSGVHPLPPNGMNSTAYHPLPPTVLNSSATQIARVPNQRTQKNTRVRKTKELIPASSTFFVKLGNLGETKQLPIIIPVAAPSLKLTLDANLKNIQSQIQAKFKVHAFHQDFWYRDQCIISGLQCVQMPLELSSILVSEITVFQQFSISVSFCGLTHYVVASAHETVLDLRQKFCAIMSIECSSHSPVLKTLGSTQANAWWKPVFLLEDCNTLMHYNIMNCTKLAIACPETSSAPASSMMQSSLPNAVDQTAGSDVPPIRPTLQYGVLPDAIPLVMQSTEPVVSIKFSVAGFGSHGLSAVDLKLLIRDKFRIPSSMNVIKSADGTVLDDYCLDICSVVGPIVCHVMHPSHIFIRLRITRGQEKIEKVPVSFAETFLSLRTRVASVFSAHADEIAFHFRGDLSILITSNQTVGNWQYILWKFNLMLDCEPLFPVEFKLFNPETPDPSARFVVQISRLYLVKHVKTILRRAFSLPSESLLLAQALPGVKHGLRKLRDNQSWESQGIIGPAAVVCYWSPVPDIELAIFAKSQHEKETNGNQAISEMRRIVHITSLDDTLAHFRDGLSPCFSGQKPDRLTIIDDCGNSIELQDSALLKDYCLLCFQMITAHFCSSIETNEPDPIAATSKSSAVSGAAGVNVDDLRKCAGCRMVLARRDYSNSQWNRGTGQSHCFPCCGRHVLPDARKQTEPQNIISVAAAIDLPLESPLVVPKPLQTLNDFISRITAMDADSDSTEICVKELAGSTLTAVGELQFGEESEYSVETFSNFLEGENVEWNSRWRAYHMQKRLALLSSAAEGCTTIHAADLPNSALEPVLQLRVMGDFSISSGPSDEEDGAFCAEPIVISKGSKHRKIDNGSDLHMKCKVCGITPDTLPLNQRSFYHHDYCSKKCRYARSTVSLLAAIRARSGKIAESVPNQ